LVRCRAPLRPDHGHRDGAGDDGIDDGVDRSEDGPGDAPHADDDRAGDDRHAASGGGRADERSEVDR